MSKICAITGKKPAVGHNVSHSNRRTKRRFEPNLQIKRIFNTHTGKWEKMRVSMHGLRVLKKRAAQ